MSCEKLEQGENVLVSAPTSSGKTIVGDFALFLSQCKKNSKAFYTTPIKALSNQKYYEFVAKYGKDNVGILTGDTVVNSEAPIVIMTTEILRNMLYENSETLNNLDYVIMDEVHYLADRFRGGVWEEVILHLPEHVQLVCLSATISNIREFGDWIDAIRGKTSVIISDKRPVELSQKIIIKDTMYDIFKNGLLGRDKLNLNPELAEEIKKINIENSKTHQKERGRYFQRNRERISRSNILNLLKKDDMLPAIFFIFSRNACEDAAQEIISSGISLNSETETSAILNFVSTRCEHILDKDLKTLGFNKWRHNLSQGVATHHAGMLPVFKQIVEELFIKGLIKVVFATETLALGINMPARTVVLEKLDKYNGEGHVPLNSREYTQLSGRAGRRGIDTIGNAVVLWRLDTDIKSVAKLISYNDYPLNSSFSPSYNMAVNLVSNFGFERSKNILETSFAQFQTDRDAVFLRKKIQKNLKIINSYKKRTLCSRGNFEEYLELQNRLKNAILEEKKISSFKFDRDNLIDKKHVIEGDVISVPKGKYRGFAAVVGKIKFIENNFFIKVVTLDKEYVELNARDFNSYPTALSKIKLPTITDSFSKKVCRNISSNLRYKINIDNLQVPISEISLRKNSDLISTLRNKVSKHPCHYCSDKKQHLQKIEKNKSLLSENILISQQITGRGNNLVTIFENICKVLEHYKYFGKLQISNHEKTISAELVLSDYGNSLRNIYGEKDFLIAECIRESISDILDAKELAAVLSSFIYESKYNNTSFDSLSFNEKIYYICEKNLQIYHRIHAIEKQFNLEIIQKPNFGIVHAVYQWASGVELYDILENEDFSAGDFVRWIKQILDLMTQLSSSNHFDKKWLQNIAKESSVLLNRGVVSYTSRIS